MNSTLTQRLSWSACIRTGLVDSEASKVYAAIFKYGPVNYHGLQKQTGLPVNHLVRAINSLRFPKNQSSPLIEVIFVAPSKTTGKKTQFYVVKL